MIVRERLANQCGVSVITIARPERSNAFDTGQWQKLAQAVRAGSADGDRVIVLTGEGRTFSAGGDFNDPDFRAMAQENEDCMDAIASSAIPVLAYINGPALGAGLPLALACDLKMAGPDASLGIPAAALSRPVSSAAIRLLISHVGQAQASAMLLGGVRLDAQRALERGAVDRIGSLGDAVEWAKTIAGFAPLAVAGFKRQIAAVTDGRLDLRLDEEITAQLLASADYAEASEARTQRRTPRYEGR